MPGSIFSRIVPSHSCITHISTFSQTNFPLRVNRNISTDFSPSNIPSDNFRKKYLDVSFLWKISSFMRIGKLESNLVARILIFGETMMMMMIIIIYWVGCINRLYKRIFWKFCWTTKRQLTNKILTVLCFNTWE